MTEINDWESRASFHAVLSLKHAKKRSLAEAEATQWMNMCSLMAHILQEQGHPDASFVSNVLREYQRMVDSYVD